MPAKNRTKTAATLSTDPFVFGIDGDRFVADGDEYTIPSYGAFKAGDIRRVRAMDEVSQMFTLLEKVADEDTLDAVDELSIQAIGEFFAAWQDAAGVSAPN